MACSPLERICIKKHVLLAGLLGALPVPGCNNSGQGTVQVDPGARHLGTDSVTKPRRDFENVKPQADPGPVEPGKLPPGRGRNGEVSRFSVRVSYCRSSRSRSNFLTRVQS